MPLKICNSLTKEEEVALSKSPVMENMNINNDEPSTAMTGKEGKQMISNDSIATPTLSGCENLQNFSTLNTTPTAEAAISGNYQDTSVQSHEQDGKSTEVSVHKATATSHLHRTSSPYAGITSEMEYVVQKIAALARSCSPSAFRTDASTKIKFGSTD